MGISDYCCFIQRNSQILLPLEFFDPSSEEITNDEEPDYSDQVSYNGSSEAVIVTIPLTFSLEDIEKMDLKEFAKFPRKTYKYSWDHVEFDPDLKWSDHNNFVIQNCRDGNPSVWEFEGEWKVSFEPNAFNAFVLGQGDPEKIPRGYYSLIFENRDYSCDIFDKENYSNWFRKINGKIHYKSNEFQFK